MHHIMKLQSNPFSKIKDGTKTVELRLNDEKRRIINIGDTIGFKEEPELMNTLHTQVVALLRYPSFRDLIYDFPIECFGGNDRETLISDVHKFYTDENERKFGVLGIKIQLIDS